MKKRFLALTLLSLATLSSCGNENGSSKENFLSDNEYAASLLAKISKDEIASFDFVDRSYDFDSYYNAKYFITGDIKKAYVNYRATHSFILHKDLIEDEVEVEALLGVENPTSNTSPIPAKGQIYTDSNNYLYDYLISENDPSQSYVNCYEMDYFTNFKTYFDYLDIIESSYNAFLSPETYFSMDDGYESYSFDSSSENGLTTFLLEGKYPGDDTYAPYIIDFEVQYNDNKGTFENITYKERSLLNTLSADFESETSSLRIWTISNIQISERNEYNGTRYTFDDIENKDQIHNAPIEKIDLSEVSDGTLDDETTLNIFKNIIAYSNDVTQMNYSMYYHDAFDIADTSSDIGDAIFSGKVISYSNYITDNVGTIQKVDSNGLPLKEEAAKYRIFTEVIDTKEAKGILRIGSFDKYMTPCLAFLSKSSFQSIRNYLDANPLYWPEISDIYSAFEKYGLGDSYLSSTSTIKISVKGEKKGDDITISSQIHTTASLTEYIDRFSFEINDNELTSMKFETSGKNYTDTYEAKFLHGNKKEFNGERIDSEDITTQISMDDFNII